MSRPVQSAIALSAGIIAFQVAGRASRDALFLSSFDVTDLPRMIAVASVVSLLLAVLAARPLARYGPARFVPAMFAASTVLLLLEFGLLRVSPRTGAVALFLHFNGLGALLVSAFWSQVNERFDPRTAKRHIGRIGLAGTAGGVAGGLLAERVAATMSLELMLPLLAAVHLACAILAVRLGGPSQPRPAEPAPGAMPVKVLARSPYLRTLAAVVLIATLAEGMIDYVFKASASAQLGSGERLLRFFALFYMGVNVLSIAAQGLLARRALERLGLARTTGVLPWGVAIGAAGGLAVPGLASAALARAVESVLRNSLYRSGYELLFTPIAPRDKRAVKGLLDVGAVRLGDLFAALLIQAALLLAGAQATTLMLVLAIACAAAGIMLVFTLHAGYVSTLEKNLVSRAVQLDLDEIQDSTTRLTVEHTISTLPAVQRASQEGAAVVATPVERRGLGDAVLTRLSSLRSRDTERVRAALQGPPLQPELVASAIALLAWDDVTREASEALGKVAGAHVGQLVDALLDPETDFAVRRRLPSALSRVAHERAVDGLLAGLHDARFEVRYRCGRALVRLAAQPGISIDAARVQAAILKEAAVDRAVWEGQRLLEREDDDPLELGAVLKERASRSLEHVFTMLSLIMPPQPLRVAFRGLFAEDAHLRGTALEYLETALPPAVREKVWPFIDSRPAHRQPSRSREQILNDLLASGDSIAIDLLQKRNSEGA